MSKKLVTSYTFTAASKTVASADFTSLEKIQLITNVTDNIIIYNFADATKGGTLSGTTLTLAYDTTTMADADKLQILVEDGSATQVVGDGGGSLTVDGTVSVTGVATAANQSTIIGHVDGIEGLLTTIDGDTGTLAGAVTSSRVNTTPYGKYTASFSQLTDGQTTQLRVNDNGELLTTITSGVGISGAVQIEGDYGVLEQRDIASPAASALPINVSVVDSAGAHVSDFATQTTLAAINTKLTSGTDIGDVTINNTSGAGAVPIQDGGNSITVDGTVGISGTVTVDSELTTADLDTGAGTDTRAVVGIAGTASGGAQLIPGSSTDGLLVNLGANNDVTVTSGTVTIGTGSNVIGALTANQSVNVAQINGVAATMGNGASGTGVQRVTIASDSTGQIISRGPAAIDAAISGNPVLTGGRASTAVPAAMSADNDIQAVWLTRNGATVVDGGVAHDAADSGNSVKIGAKAIAALSGATLVAAADRTDLYSDLDGAQLVRPNAAIGDYVSGNANNTDGTSTQVLAAGAAGIKHYITDVTITNTSASNIYVELKDGTTTKWTFPVPANAGVTHSFGTPLGGTAATAWNFDPSAATTTVYCSVSGFKSKI